MDQSRGARVDRLGVVLPGSSPGAGYLTLPNGAVDLAAVGHHRTGDDLAARAARRSGRRARAVACRWLFVLSVLLSFLGRALVAGRACAEARCAAGSKPWVLVQLRAEGWTEGQRQTVLLDLHRTLAVQGIDACLADAHPTREPLAILSIDLPSNSRATVDIEVRDAVTHKRLRRDVDLARIPVDGRDLAIAIEADELLRASWAELALDTERTRLAVRAVGQPAAAPGDTRSGRLGARLAAEHYGGGGTTLIGVEAFGRARIFQRLQIEVAGGARVAPAATHAEHGRVRALAAGATLTLLTTLSTRRWASIDAATSLSASRLEFRADPLPGAAGFTYANLLLVARAGVYGRVAIGRSVRLSLGLAGGPTLRGVEVTDTRRVVAGATGIEWSASLGVETP